MKKYLLLILKLLLPVAGLAFIAWSLTWTDHIVLPQGFPLSPTQTLSQEIELPITATRDSSQGLVYELAGHAAVIEIDQTQLGTRADQPRLKPGVVTTIRNAKLPPLLLGFALVGLIFPLQTIRWLILMRCRGMQVPLTKAFRLMMVGVFFNICMPGTTGGDVVKAYYAAKHSNQRGAAIMSIIYDRLTGMLGLVVLAIAAGLTMLDNPVALRITLIVAAALLVFMLAWTMYFSQTLRHWLKIDQLLKRLPGGEMLAKVDAAAVAYRHHKIAVLASVLVSLPMHLSLASAVALAGYALGMTHPWGLMLAVVPVLLLAGSVPLTYQGLGVMEWIALTLLLTPNLATANQIIGMLLIFRLFMVAWALTGSIFILRGDIHLFAHEQPPASATSQLPV